MPARRLACNCAAYSFPHRASGGKCQCPSTPRFFPATLPKLCAACGQPASTHMEDEGYGLTEAWGVVTNHVDLVEVTDCCEESLVPNTPKEAEENWRQV